MKLLPTLLLAAAGAGSLQAGTLEDPAIDELSGLTLSRSDPTVLWGHNDSGSLPKLYRIGIDGANLGSISLPDATNYDWEDIAAFRDARGPALLVADTGDNLELSTRVTLYALRDPGRGKEATQLWRLDFRYEDGPRDCEAIAVDEASGEIVLVSKRNSPPRIYTLPLPSAPPRGEQVARFEGVLAGLPPAPKKTRSGGAGPWRFSQMPTGFSISADGRTAVIVTPHSAYLWRRAGSERWAAALQRKPRPLRIPRLAQVEAIALSADGQALYLGSEGSPAPFVRIPMPAAD